MSLLVRTPSPHPTESLMGFILRTSEMNGYTTPWPILRMVGVAQNQMRTAGIPVAPIAAVLGKNLEDLEHIAYKGMNKDGDFFKILGHSIGQGLRSSLLRLESSAICPCCVSEEGYVDAFWDLRIAVACPKHRCEVLQACPACGKKLRFFRPGLLVCGCGQSLSDASTPEVSIALVELMAIVQAKLHNKPLSSVSNESGFPVKYFERLPLREFLMIVGLLGKHGLRSKGIIDDAPMSIAKSAAEVFGHWPNGYHQMLSDIGGKTLDSDRPATGFCKQFESFYVSVFKNRIFGQETDVLKDEFVNFGLKHWGNAVVGSSLLRGKTPEEGKRFVTKTEFAREHGLWKPAMERMIADGTLVTKRVVAGKKTHVVVDTERSKLPAESKGIVTDRIAAQKVDAPVSVLKHLRSVDAFETKSRLVRENSWYQEDVEAFLVKVQSLAAMLDSCPTGGITFKAAMRLKLRDAAAKGDIAAAVFDGRLRVLGRIGDNLGGILLDEKQVREVVTKIRAEIDGNGYAFCRAAKLTGLDILSIKSAVDAGLLSSFKRKRSVLVSAESIERFNAEYMPLSVLAKKLGTLSMHLTRKCRALEIPLISLARMTGASYQSVLSKADAIRLVSAVRAGLGEQRCH